jgi:energy-coupling factor transporter ATP-binding protein EcfA2
MSRPAETLSRAPTMFGALNARYLEPEQIAERFVPPPRFEELCNRGHTQLIGPRGAGKTTLLRMLDGAALEAWDHPAADGYRAKIDYTGIFIPTDRTWSRQVEGLAEGLSDDHQFFFGAAAFTTHMLKSLVGAMHHRVRGPQPRVAAHRRVSLSPGTEEDMCLAASATWMLPSPAASFEALAEALEDRLSYLDTMAENEILRGPEGRGERLASLGYLGLQFVNASMALIERFDHAVSEPHGTWAFLIDEFELAPPTVRAQILKSLRGVSQRLLFKISMAPYADDVIVPPEPDAPTPINDFQVLGLTWPRKSEDADDKAAFCSRLFDAEARRRGLSINPIDLLGRSAFETEPDEHADLGTAYSSSSRLGRRLRQLAAADSTFAEYLRKKDIHLDRLEQVDGTDRAQDVRKIVSLAAVRLEYRSSDERREATGQETQPRKVPQLYCGASTVFDLTEGNPRWFIAIVGRLMDHFAREGELPESVQAGEILRMSNLFRSVLRSIPARHDGALTALSVLDRIGAHIHERVVRANFNPDPVGSFRVTSATDADLHEPLRLALNAGAIIHVPPVGQTPEVLTDLTDRRFRLAYLLAPYYEIPVRLGRDMEISQIRRQPHRQDQLPLGFEEPPRQNNGSEEL